MRTLRCSLLTCSLLFVCIAAQGQSGPAFLRDHVHGPGGGVVMTAEPDTIAPSALPGLAGSDDSGSCVVSLSWNAASDIGSGVSGYNVYRGSSIYVGSTTDTAYDIPDNPIHNINMSFSVKAYDQVGNLGPLSSVVVFVYHCTLSPVKPPLAMSFIPRPGPSGAPGQPRPRNLVDYLRWLARRGEFSLLPPVRNAIRGGQ